MRKLFLLLMCFAAGLSRVSAVTPVPYLEVVGFTSKISGSGSSALTVYGESAGGSAGTVTVSDSVSSGTHESDQTMVMVRPGKAYTVDFSASGPTDYELSFTVPTGYVCYVNGQQTDLISRDGLSGSYSHSYSLELRPLQAVATATWGAFSGIMLGKSVSWEVGLGGLRNGGSAGGIMFKELDLSGNHAVRDRLYYTAPNNYLQITVIKDGASNQRLRQIAVPSGYVDLVDITDGYEIRFYAVSQGTWSGSVYTFTGSPWKTITVVSTLAGQMLITATEGSVVSTSEVTETGQISTGIATGGTMSSSGGGSYTVHTFTSSGTFVLSAAATVDYLVVGGGGGGGSGLCGGGGGGGSVEYLTSQNLAAGSYDITVGAGGGPDANGNASTLKKGLVTYTTAYGGGYGAGSAGNYYANSGGSGGGGNANQFGASGGSGSNVYAGGGGDNGGTGWSGGGGGGAGGNTQNPAQGGGTYNGGNGLSVSISGSPTYYSGGGGGGYGTKTGGAGGGGAGGTIGNAGSSGSPNTGGGGGGSGVGGANTGGSGGSGIVIIRYTGGQAGNFERILKEKTGGSTWQRTTKQVSSVPASGERELIHSVYTGDSTSTTDLVARTKHVYRTKSWGEELYQVILDPDTAALTTTYAYYEDAPVSNDETYRGSYRRVKSITEPTGNWVAYEYHDGYDRRGQIYREYRPFLEAPAVVGFNASQGRVVEYTYTYDWTGRYRELYTRQEKIDGVLTGSLLRNQDYDSATSNPRRRYEQHDYSDSTHSIMTHVESYRADADSNYVGLPVKITKPNGEWLVSLYAAGFYFPSTHGFGVNGNGSDWREWHFRGTGTTTGGGEAVSTYDGRSFDTIWLVPNKSTLEVVIRGANGATLRTETHVYTGSGAFSLIAWEEFTYNAQGRLTERLASNGATTDYHYTDGQLDLVTDPSGAETAYRYDKLGRVDRIWKKQTTASGFTLPGDIYTHYVYDGADRVRKSVVTASASLPGSPGAMDLVSETSIIDLAGRVKETIAPGGYTTSYVYTSGGKVITITLPGSVTRITETHLDGQLKSVTGSSVVAEYLTYAIDGLGNRTIAHRLAASNSTAVSTTTSDWLGRKLSVEQPAWSSGTVTRNWYYNSNGQLWKFTQPGVAPTLYEYDTLGGLKREGLDLGGTSDVLDVSGTDRITDHAWEFFTSSSNWWRRETTSTYATASSGTATQTGKVEQQLSGLSSNQLSYGKTYDIFGNVTTQSVVVDRANKKLTTTVDAPDSSIDAVQIAYNGLLVSAKDAAGIEMKYGYDALGRQNKVFDPRTVGSGSGSPFATTTAFKSGSNEIDTVTDPAGIVQATYTYDAAGRVESVTNALSKVARYAYNTRNQKTQEWGDATYPAEYVYDAMGRVYQQKTYAQSTATFTNSTWPSSPNNAQTTTWNYDAATNLLASKTDAAGKSVSYTYTTAGQIYTREWARLKTGTSDRVKATYAYSSTTGELTGVSYNDGTPGLAYTYNRLGQTATVNDGGIGYTRTFAYNLGGTLELQSETLGAGSGDFYGNRRLTYGYDTTTTGALGRPTAMKLGSSSTDNLYQATTYGYAADGRLNSVAAAGQTFGYVYTANSHLIEEVTNTTLTYSDKRLYDPKRDWVDERETKWGSSPVTKAKFAYAQDDLGRVTSVTKTGTLFDVYGPGSPTAYGLKTSYGYNDRSELTSENTTDLATSPVDLTGRQTSYAYDHLGNRTGVTKARPSGDAGGNLSSNYNPTSYEINSLNQYRRRTVPGVYDVALMSSASSVTVDGGGMVKQGLYFFRGHPLNNSSGPVFDSLTITPSSGTGGTTDAFLPHTNEDFAYDDDGNLTRDGRWVYQYDAENRLVAMFTRGAPEDANKTAAANVAVWGSGLLQQKLLFTYDYLGRRVQKVTYYWTGSAWALDDQTKFVYNGWNCIATLDAAGGNAVIADYYWGLDLSGTSQGAGGIGGLLLVKEGSNAYLPVYDALGNVHAMLTAASVTLGGTSYAAGDIVAAYEYDAFGNTLRESGPVAASNPFRFATKYADLETGLLYHDTRYYSPSLGRFINRDTIGEQGGLNLYAYVSNRVPNAWDRLGMAQGEGWQYVGAYDENGNWSMWIDWGGGVSIMDIEQAKIGAAGNIDWGSSPHFSDMSDENAYNNAAWHWENMSSSERDSVLARMNTANARIEVLTAAANGENGLQLLTGAAGFAVVDSSGAVVMQAGKDPATGELTYGISPNAPNSGYGAPGAECAIVTVQTIQKLSGVPVDSREKIIGNFGLPAANFEPGGDGLPSKPGAATDYINKALNPSGLKVDRVDVGPGNFDFANLVAKGNLLILGAEVSNDKDAIRAGGRLTLNHLVAAKPTGAANGSLTIYNPTGSGGKVTYTVAQAMANQYPKNSEGLSGRVWYVYNTDD